MRERERERANRFYFRRVGEGRKEEDYNDKTLTHTHDTLVCNHTHRLPISEASFVVPTPRKIKRNDPVVFVSDLSELSGRFCALCNV